MFVSLNAQTYQAVSSKTTLARKTQMGVMAKPTPIQREKSAFYSNDFSSSAVWTISNNAAGAGSNDNWVIGTAGPAGTFAIDPIASTSAANGFAMFDSDLLCSGDQSAWIGNSNAIDCSAHSSVVIEFESFYRKFNDEVYVQVSTDNVTFTDYRVYESFTNNDITANPELTYVNISATAASQATVYIRFLFLSDASNGGDGCGYAWMVDDVSLREANAYDLKLNSSYWGTEGFWGARLPYYIVPTSQLSAVKFSGVVENAGGSDQTNVAFTSNAPTYNGTSALVSLAVGQSDTLDATPDLTLTSSLGVTNVSMNVSSPNTDFNPVNNINSVSIEVHPTTYSRDNGLIDGTTFNSGLAYEVGNIYDIFADDVTSSATVFIEGNTNVGTTIYVRLYTVDATTGDFIFADESTPYVVTAADLDAFVTLNLTNPVNLLADNSYLIVAGTLGDGGATNDFVVGTAGASEAQTSFFQDEAATWFYTTNTPMVRLNLAGIESSVIITSDDSDNVLCPGGSLTLTSPSATGNVWSTGEVTQSIVVSAAGSYSVTANGTVSNTLIINSQVVDNNITLAGSTLTATQANGATYQWVDCGTSAPVSGAVGQNFAPLLDGSYSANITLNGCLVTSTCVAVVTPPNVTSSDIDNVLCAGSSLVLTSSKPTGNVWSPNGETTQSITVSTAGSYSVAASGFTSNVINVSVQAIDNTTILNGSTITAAQTGAAYQWVNCANSSNIAGETAQFFTATTDGDYSVDVTLNGCTVSSTCTNITLAVSISSNDADNILCPNGSLILTSTKLTGNLWSNGPATQSITVTTPGDYSVTVNGVTSNIITVTLQALDNSVSLTGISGLTAVSQSGAGYQWVDCANNNSNIVGAVGQVFTPTVNGNYGLIVTINGCNSPVSACTAIGNVGLNENEAFSSFSVYPNPAAENIAIDFSLRAESAVNVSITDLSGKVVYTSNLGNKAAGASSLNVNTAAFANGIYVVNVLTNNGIATEKLVIRK